MPARWRFVLVVVLGLAVVAAAAEAQTKLLRFPDIHGDRVAFCYAGDIWTASASGGTATRLTAHPGLELFAKFSPDGKWIAFTGQYDGDEQVYVVPAEGGVPRQLTYYPARGPLAPRRGYDNQVYGWTPDGKRGPLPLDARRRRHRQRGPALHRRRRRAGSPTALPMPTAGAGDFSPDGKRIVYSPLFRDFRTWKRYEGGWAQDLFVFDLATNRREADRRHRCAPSATRCGSADGDLLRLRPRRHAQPLPLRPRRARRSASSPAARPGTCAGPAPTTTAGSSTSSTASCASTTSRPARTRPTRHHRARRRRGLAARRAIAVEKCIEDFELSPEGRAGAVRGPRRRLHGADRERADPQPDRLLERPRQVGALVARRQDDRLRLRPQRRGPGLARRPGRHRQARAADHEPRRA